MKTRTKNITKLATVAAACTLAASLGMSSIFASAADTSTNGRYYTDYTSQEVAEEEAEKLNKEIASEGIVMLKNDGSLPIAKGSTVSVLGIAQDCMIETSGSITESLTNAGLKVNPTLEEMYTSDSATYSNFGTETSLNSIQKQSMRLYNDLGVVVIGRGTSGESQDRSLATSEYDDETYLGKDTGWEHEAHSNDGTSDYKHEMQLTESEEELIKLAEQYCKKVVVLYSASYTFEMANLQDDDNINGIYWIGRLGDGSIDAVGEILTGEINPSGKTVDEWTRDFTNDPTYVNTFVTSYGTSGYGGVDYEEDIYLGYKYYETYWYEATQSNASPKISGETATADEWYSYNVVYPFGYGLSYTDFKFELLSLKDNNGNTISDESPISSSDLSSSSSSGAAKITSLTAEVKVTNIGDYAGKETVQVYITAPYTKGETEKAYYTLVGYAKTSEIAAGSSETVSVTFNVQDFASYDNTDANKDNHKGYELDAGTYVVSVMNSSSHSDAFTTASAAQQFSISGGTAHLDLDDYSGNEIENLFSEENGDYYSMAVSDDVGSMVLMTRSDFDETKPTAPTSSQLTLSSTALAKLKEYTYIDAEYIDDSQYDWYKKDSDIPSSWTQGTGVVGTNGMYSITLDDMAGVELYDKDGNISAAWTTFINQLTWDEIATLLNSGRHLTESLSTIGKLETNDENGPNYSYNSNMWCGEPTVAATWNVDLAEQYGMMAGNLLLMQDVTGWYGPGMNTHRNAFCGRNPEYYSQDGIQGGYIAAAVCSGAASTGINVYVKHFAMYDIASLYSTASANISEQNMRENYLKVFQMAMQEGGANAAMSSISRTGYQYNGGSYNLIQRLTRDEWGWTGFYVTDLYIGIDNMTVDGLIRAGAEIPDGDLTSETYSYTNNSGETISGSKALSGEWDAENNCVLVNGKASATQWYCARMSVTRLLYNCANSAANYNGVTDSSVSETYSLTQGNSVSESVLPEQYTAEDAGYIISCSIVSGDLPVGLTIDNGILTGTPESAGTYNIVMDVTIDGWIHMDLNLTIKVASRVSLEDDTDISTLTTDDTVDVYVDTDLTGLSYTSLTYSISDGALPDGLTMSSDGRITGTPTTAGTYSFTVMVSAVDYSTYTVNMDSSTMEIYKTLFGFESDEALIQYLIASGSSSIVYPSGTFYYDYTITVTGDDVTTSDTVTVENIVLNSDGDLEITFSDGTTTTLDITTAVESDYVTDIAVDSDGNIVVTFADGTSSTVEMTSESSGSGCSDSISANIITVVAMLTIAAAAVVVVRIKRAKK